MTLARGTTLGPYQILAPLGAGGMGEVYRARDPRLERSVAIKIIHANLSSPGIRERFVREARAISGLTHPNICALFDVGQQDGLDYLVMEYLEGETLADRISRGSLPASQVLRYGAEIALALHHAHRRRILHRDLKPGNVMLTAGGVKLLDFGLAKETTSDSVSPDALTMRETPPLTAEGTIVGTLPYMSPEQIEGKTLDARSDIFALGVILYEMATGQRPFQGTSAAALSASIISSDPPPQPGLPPQLDRVIRIALEKDPEQRWQSAHDLARQLQWIGEPSSPSITALPPISPGSRKRLPTAAALALAVLAAGFTVWGIARGTKPPVVAATRLSVALPEGSVLFRRPEDVPFALSPDGRRIAFAARTDGKRHLYLRGLDAVAVRKLEGTDGATAPFWSSDGDWIGYSRDNKLWKTRAAGGTPEVICTVGSPAVASWRGDSILFSSVRRGPVYRVSAAGGKPEAVTTINAAEGEVRHAFPFLLEDGRHFLYIATSSDAERRLMFGSLDSPARTRIATSVSAARVSGGRLLYVSDGKLLAQNFDPATGLSGDPRTVAEDVSYFFMTSRAEFDVSADGVLAYATETGSGRLSLVDRKGTALRVLEKDASIFLLDVAPDGKRAAVTVTTRATGLMDIWIYDLARGVRDRFTSDPGTETTPVWSPDGRTIVYSQGTGGPPRLVRRALSAEVATSLVAPGTFQMAGSFSPDGKDLYYTSMGSIMRLALDASNRAEIAVKIPSSTADDPQVSPDGRWLAFVADPSGAHEVYVQNLASGERVRISDGGGGFPRWRKDSGELFYVSPDDTVVSVTTRSGRFDDVVSTHLFHVRNSVVAFDALPDGRAFLLAETIPAAGDSLIHIATGW